MTRRILTNPNMLPKANLAKELVSIDEWDTDVWVHELTVGELDAYRAGMMETKGAKVVRLNLEGNTSRLLSLAIKDDEFGSNRVFYDADIDALKCQGAAPIEKLAAVARRLSRLDDDGEELVGNSEPEKTDDSSSI